MSTLPFSLKLELPTTSIHSSHHYSLGAIYVQQPIQFGSFESHLSSDAPSIFFKSQATVLQSNPFLVQVNKLKLSLDDCQDAISISKRWTLSRNHKLRAQEAGVMRTCKQVSGL
jgi:hypothetical protein